MAAAWEAAGGLSSCRSRSFVGRHRFAKQVLDNYDHTCAFCGLSPKHLEGHRLQLASHIKPWKDSNKECRAGMQSTEPRLQIALDSPSIPVA